MAPAQTAGGHHAHSPLSRRSERRQPEHTALYQVVARHWPAFREQAEEAGGLPKFVTTEFDEYLRCGVLEHGFLRLACTSCGHERLVGFSCKRRGFCPSCLGRRMTDSALHLTESVFPKVMVRQWVCSLPWGLRALLGYDRRLCSLVLRAFTEEVQRSLKRRAKKVLGLIGVALAHTAGITFIQRFDSALRLNVHFHSLFLDGVYIEQGEGSLEFCELAEPTPEQVADVARRTARRVADALRKAGKSLTPELDTDHEDTDAFAESQAALALCYASAARGVDITGERAGQPSLRLIDQDIVQRSEPAAVVQGVNVHAATVVDGRDRKRLERLCRYLARPPIAQDRLELLADGRVQYTLKKAWRDGTRAIVLEPHGLIARLCAMIPPPRFNMIRFHGLFAPAAKRRAQVVPQKDCLSLTDTSPAELARARQMGLFGRDELAPRRRPWAHLLRHVFLVDVTVCPDCGGRMKWLELATETRDILRILADLGIAPRGPPNRPHNDPAPWSTPRQLPLPF